MSSFFKDKTILITGATGFLGQALVQTLLHLPPEQAPQVIRVFSRDESKQHDMHKALRAHSHVRFFLGDVRDSKRVHHAMDGVDIVIHAAALKHVVACEYNAFEALRTNILGTEHVIEAALAAGVEKVLFTSSDKAVNPCNTMGTSKLFAERLMTAAQYYSGAHNTVFASVRFGNVLGSRGSLIPTVRNLIERDQAVTVTDPQMTRFVMSLQQSVELVLRSVEIACGGEVFILKMPVVQIGDLIDVCIDSVCEQMNKDPQSVAKDVIGVQAGEKLYEELATVEEVQRMLDLGRMFVVLPQMQHLTSTHTHYQQLLQAGQASQADLQQQYSSHHEPVLNRSDIRKLLQEVSAWPQHLSSQAAGADTLLSSGGAA